MLWILQEFFHSIKTIEGRPEEQQFIWQWIPLQVVENKVYLCMKGLALVAERKCWPYRRFWDSYLCHLVPNVSSYPFEIFGLGGDMGECTFSNFIMWGVLMDWKWFILSTCGKVIHWNALIRFLTQLDHLQNLCAYSFFVCPLLCRKNMLTK